MANDNTRNQYQGFLLPDPRLKTTAALWEAESTYTEQNTRAGMPVASGDYEMVLEAVGAQSAGGEVDVVAVQGAGTGADAQSATFAWKGGSDGVNEYRGWEGPAHVSMVEAVDWGTGVGRTNPDAVTLKHPDYTDRVVVAAESATSNSIEVDWRDPKTGVWTNVTVHDGSALGYGLPAYRPCLLEVGRRLYCLFFCRGEASASSFYGIRVMYSEDGGESWGMARRYATTETDMLLTGAGGASQYNLQKLRAVYSRGQVLVVAWLQTGAGSGVTDCFRQYASADLGLRLDVVETWDPTSNEGGDFDIEVAEEQFVLTYVKSDGELYWRRSGSAYSPLTLSEELGSTSSAWSGNFVTAGSSPTRITGSDLAMCAADDGMLWLTVRYANSSATKQHSVTVLYSDDAGASWNVWGQSPATITNRGLAACWWNPEATDHYPTNFGLTWHRGRLVVAHNFVADDNANDNSLMVAYLGGYSDLTLPPIREAIKWSDRAAYLVTGLPYELSDNTAAWTNTGGGAAAYTVTLTASGEQIATGDGAGTADNRYYLRTDSVTGDVAFIGEVTCDSDASSTSQAFVAWFIRIDDGTRGVECSIRFASGQIAVYDEVASSQLAAISAPTMLPTPHDVRVGMYASEDASVKSLRVWYRSSDTSEDRQWTLIGAYSLADDGGTIGTNRVQYGHIASGGGGTTVTSTWQRKPHYSFGDISALMGAAGSVHFWHEWVAADQNPTNLSGRLFSPLWTYVDDFVRIRAIDGPAHEGEAWTITPTSEFPLSRVWPSESRSPRVRWRSTDDASSVEVAVAFDSTLLGTDESHPGSPVWGLFLGGVNFATAKLEGYSSSSWSTIASVDLADASRGVAYTREGATLVADADTFDNFAHNELAGWDVRFITTNTVRRLKGNSTGRFASTGGAGPRSRWHLDGADGTEPASGDLALRPREGVVLVHLPAANSYSGFRLRIPAQPTVEGHFEIGTMMLGPVLIQGAPNGRGRSLDHVPGWEREEYQDGSSSVRNRRPMARQVAIAWPDGVFINPWHSTTTEPDYRSTTDTSGVEGATYRSGWVYDLVHSMRALDGHPVVYLPYIPRSDGSADTIHLVRYFQLVYGHIDGSIEVTQQTGEEWTDENLTIASLEILEER